ncbi:MAG: cyclic nucleotide-binding domain-containing protein [Bdellovibrionales bacterium]|nr:cyclic nucleotide-binding domain-containing protein [Bdellovibrionales bacterium]
MKSSSKEIIKLTPGEYLLREGEESFEMYYVQSGTLGVLKRKGDQEQSIGTIVAGEVVGEMSFLDKKPRSASVRAMSESILIVIPHEKLDATLDSLPKWFTALQSTLLERLRKANSRIRV